MSLSSVIFIKNANGTGGVLPGEDFITGFVTYTDVLPSGFSSVARVKEVFSLPEAEALGIVGDYSDETKATGNLAISAIGANGDTVVISVIEWKKTVVLGTYTKVAGDTTPTLIATAVRAAINALTGVHGYIATGSGVNVAPTARAGMGVFLNGTSKLTAVFTGTLAGTLTDFSGGVASVLKPIHYHIQEYFRANPKGDLYVGLYPVPVGAYDFTEIQTVQQFANGKIKQIGAYYKATQTSTHVTAAQAVATALEVLNMPLVIGISGDCSATTIGALTDLATLTAPQVFINVGQDGANIGNDIFRSMAKSIGSIGAQLGTISKSAVSQSIAEVGAFNVVTGAELDVIAFTTGELYSAQSQTALGNLENKKYTFLVKQQPGLAGSYWNYAYTAVTLANDFSTIERNRTIYKAIRGGRVALLPLLNARLTLNANGTLTPQSIEGYKSVLEPGLDDMQTSGDLSGSGIVINPAQNVLATSKVAITLKLLGVVIGKDIEVGIGFVAKLT